MIIRVYLRFYFSHHFITLSPMNILLQLYYIFFKIGLFTFGGGIAMMPMMEAELVNGKKWITSEELLDYFAVGQSTPGIIAVNVATFVGYKKSKILGGIVATLGVITPSIIIICLLAGLISSVDEYPMVQKALNGINVAVCALMTDVVLNFAKKTAKGIVSVVLMAASFSTVYFFNVPTYLVILSAAFLATVVFFVKKGRN